MTRTWTAGLAVAIVLVLGIVLGAAVFREREYQALLARGDAALANGQSFQAIEAFSGALALREDAMIAYLKRGEAYRQRGESGPALRDLRTAERLDPRATRPAELLGDVNFEMGRFQQAADSYRRFVAMDDRSPRVLYKLGVALYQAGRFDEASQSFRQALTLDTALAEAHYMLGLCLKARGSLAEAAEAFDAAVRLAPRMVAPREELAAVHLAAGRSRPAIEQLEAVADLEPTRPERQTAVALAYARLGRIDSAINLLGRAAERYPDNVTHHLAIGRIWLEAAAGARPDRVALRKAVAALQPLATRPGASGEALALYGRALFLAGRTAEAEPVLRQATETLPVRLEAFAWHADAAERLGQFGSARRSLDRWNALAPGTSSERGLVLERAAALAQRNGESAAALAALTEATDIPGRRASAFTALAQLQITRQQPDDARQTVQRGLAIFPQDAALLSLARRLKAA